MKKTTMIVTAAACAWGMSHVAVLAQDDAVTMEIPTGWTPELVMDVKRVGNVRVSPDGMKVLFEVSEALMDDKTSEWRTQIHLSNIDGSNEIQLTRGEKSCNGARWSPDGTWIAFTSERGEEKSNIFRINVSGGEAEQLTDLESNAGNFRWSPDGSMIAFTMSDKETEDQEKAKKQKNDARVVDDDIKMSRLYVMNVEGDREPRLLTDGAYSVRERWNGSGSFDWSPDGSTIAFTHTPTPKVDDWTQADISLVNVETASVRTLLTSSAREGQPTYSPDGQSIAVTISDDPATWAFKARVHVVSAQGGEPRPLAMTFDERPEVMGWSSDGHTIFVSESYRTVSRIYSMPISGSDAMALTPDDMLVSNPNFSKGRTHFGFTSESPSVAPEAFVTSIGSFRPDRVSDVQDFPETRVGSTETLTWKSTDGREIEGMLTLPVDYEQGTPLPMVVVVHGGPAGVFSQRFIASHGAYPIAAFAEGGMAVLRVNPRGSSGYGAEFRYANYEDWGGMDYLDILTGVDTVIDMGIADPDRLGIMGWSYGGFMTSWVVTQTDRFKAASIGAGVTNLLSFTGTADIPGFLPDYFAGESWEQMGSYLAHSAMGHVQNVVTPSLIQHGENDVRVPTSQGYEFYNALKRKGVPVKMVVYPRQPHGIREPKLQLDAMNRNLEWFTEMLLRD